MAPTTTALPDVTISVTTGEAVGATSTPSPTPTSTPAVPAEVTPTGPKRYIGRPLVLLGYGPPDSEVYLDGIGISEKTFSRQDGYFEFSKIYSHTFLYPDLCIYAKDSLKRVTQPTCVPALPEGGIIPARVGPVYLSPTISIKENNALVGDTSTAWGKTIPNANIKVNIAKEENKLFSFVGNVYAYNFPVYEIKSDEKGDYEFSLPTQDVATYKIFTSSVSGDNNSTKSNTLTFSVLSEAENILNNISDLFSAYKLLWVIIIEVLVVIFLLRGILKSTTVRHKRKKKEKLKPKRTKNQDETVWVGLKKKSWFHLPFGS